MSNLHIRDGDSDAVEVINDSLDRAVSSINGIYLVFEVSSNPDIHSLSRIHSVFAIEVDDVGISLRETDSGSARTHEDVNIDSSLIPEDRVPDVSSVVSVLEVLVIHFVGHLGHGLPVAEPLGQILHLVVNTEEGVVESKHFLSFLRKVKVLKLSLEGQSSIVSTVLRVS